MLYTLNLHSSVNKNTYKTTQSNLSQTGRVLEVYNGGIWSTTTFHPGYSDMKTSYMYGKSISLYMQVSKSTTPSPCHVPGTVAHKLSHLSNGNSGTPGPTRAGQVADICIPFLVIQKSLDSTFRASQCLGHMFLAELVHVQAPPYIQ